MLFSRHCSNPRIHLYSRISRRTLPWGSSSCLALSCDTRTNLPNVHLNFVRFGWGHPWSMGRTCCGCSQTLLWRNAEGNCSISKWVVKDLGKCKTERYTFLKGLCGVRWSDQVIWSSVGFSQKFFQPIDWLTFADTFAHLLPVLLEQVLCQPGAWAPPAPLCVGGRRWEQGHGNQVLLFHLSAC